MNQTRWEKSSAKKLVDAFLEIEESQYPEIFLERLKYRHEQVRKLILEFGADYVRINNYSNMLQLSSSIIIDVFDPDNWRNGDMVIELGSEPHELGASRTKQGKLETFDFRNWKWVADETKN